MEMASSCHGHRRVRHDDREVREVGGDVVEQHRRGVAQLDAAPAGEAGADPGLPGVEQRGHAQLLQRLVERVEAGSLGSKACRLGWNLNPRTPWSVDQPAGPGDGALARVRVDRAERDEHVRVLGGLVGDLLAGQRRVPGARGRVDGEHHGRDAPGAVVLGDRRQGRGAVLVGAEVLGGGVEQLLVEGEAAVAVLLDVHVHVDGVQGGEIHGVLLAVRSGPWRRAGRSGRRRGGRPARPGRCPPARRRRPATSLASSSGVSVTWPQVAPPRLDGRPEVLQDVREAARARRTGAG